MHHIYRYTLINTTPTERNPKFIIVKTDFDVTYDGVRYCVADKYLKPAKGGHFYDNPEISGNHPRIPRTMIKKVWDDKGVLEVNLLEDDFEKAKQVFLSHFKKHITTVKKELSSIERVYNSVVSCSLSTCVNPKV